MASGVDKRALEKLVKQLRAAGSGALYDRMKKRVAAEALTQLQLGFRQSRDPYGKAWPPPEHRSGKPLLDTGRMRNSFTIEITFNGFKLGTKVIYAPVHQYGATIKAKTAKALRIPFAMQGPAPKGVRGGGGLGTSFVFVKSVTIPRRQMVPEGTLGPIWGPAFEKTSDRTIAQHFGMAK